MVVLFDFPLPDAWVLCTICYTEKRKKKREVRKVFLKALVEGELEPTKMKVKL